MNCFENLCLIVFEPTLKTYHCLEASEYIVKAFRLTLGTAWDSFVFGIFEYIHKFVWRYREPIIDADAIVLKERSREAGDRSFKIYGVSIDN